MWSKVEYGIYKVQEIMISLALVAIMFAVLLQVVARNVGWQSLGLPEYAAIGMTIMTFIGASALTYSKEYISVELSQIIKSRKIIMSMNILVDIVIIVFAVLFLPISYNFFDFVLNSGEKTLEVGIPLYLPYGAIVLSMVLMILHSLSHLVKNIFAMKRLLKEVDV